MAMFQLCLINQRVSNVVKPKIDHNPNSVGIFHSPWKFFTIHFIHLIHWCKWDFSPLKKGPRFKAAVPEQGPDLPLGPVVPLRAGAKALVMGNMKSTEKLKKMEEMFKYSIFNIRNILLNGKMEDGRFY